MKKKYKIGYFFSQAFVSFKRNISMGFASVLVLASCLVILGSFSILLFTVNSNLERVYQMDQVIIYLEDGVKTDEVEAVIKGKMQNTVESYTIVTKEEGLAKQREKYADHPEVLEPLGTDNPLPDAFEIKYTGKSGTLKELKNEIDEYLIKPGLVLDRYVNSDEVVGKVEQLKKIVTVVFFGVWVLVFFVSLLVVVNTIKISVHAKAAEIEVMRYVGAENWFITLPFVLQSIYVAVAATLIALPVQWVIYSFMFVKLVENINYIVLTDALTLAPFIAGGFLVVSMLLCVISSIFSVNKYSKK